MPLKQPRRWNFLSERGNRVYGLVCGLSLLTALAPAVAQVFPTKPIRMIVPYAAGGVTDTLGRLVSAEMAKALGQVIIVDNRAGAGGVIAADAVAKSAPDGHTICFCSSGPVLLLPLQDAKLPYDAAKDLAPVSRVYNLEFMIAVRAGHPTRTLAELIAYIKAQPGKYGYGQTGIGGSVHLAGELFKNVTGVELISVPYKSEPQMVVDLLGGQLEVGILSTQALGPLVKGGKVKALAAMAGTRSHTLPDVPTVAESGYKGFHVNTWTGLFVPSATPRPVIEKIAAAAIAAVKHRETQDKIYGYGLTPIGSGPEALAESMRAETDMWRTLIRKLGGKIE